MELVSVIMPAYNASRFIAETIQSVQNQTYTNWELIIVDDGSTDNTYEIAAKFAANDKRIKIKQQKNSGVSSARNLALDCARGGYIAFLDADDLWDKEFLAATTSRAAECADIIYTLSDMISEENNWQKRPLWKNTREGYLEDFEAAGGLNITFQTSAVLVNRSLIEDYNLRFNTNHINGEDMIFFMQLACLRPIVCVPKPLSCYRELKRSLSHQPWIPKLQISAITIYQELFPFAARYRPQAVPILEREYVHSSYMYLRGCISHGFMQAAQEAIIKLAEPLEKFTRKPDEKIGRRLKCRLYIHFKNQAFMLRLINKLLG